MEHLWFEESLVLSSLPLQTRIDQSFFSCSAEQDIQWWQTSSFFFSFFFLLTIIQPLLTIQYNLTGVFSITLEPDANGGANLT